ncbi:MAG TPA: hypothetical protein VMV94_08770, partial [Phycisphaerae bacterium]|nr:hypothetical protein [Phycisphaerae bacterium]
MMKKLTFAGCVAIFLSGGLMVLCLSGCGKSSEKKETTAKAALAHDDEAEDAPKEKGEQAAGKEKKEQNGEKEKEKKEEKKEKEKEKK